MCPGSDPTSQRLAGKPASLEGSRKWVEGLSLLEVLMVKTTLSGETSVPRVTAEEHYSFAFVHQSGNEREESRQVS